jgi:hypothetical protein
LAAFWLKMGHERRIAVTCAYRSAENGYQENVGPVA